MITTIDTRYLGYPEFAAVYLLQSQGEWAIIDNGTQYSVPAILEGLRKAGAVPGAVRYLVVTHVHLDHAGGTSELLSHCPNATILAHPRSLRHLTDPTRLVEGAKRVYGEKEFSRLYGRIVPIASDRIRTVQDEERVELGSSRLRFLHTLGHAKHHICAVWEATGEIFTGDSFGLRYPALSKKTDFVFASTSPVDFDGPAAVATADRILALRPPAVYPTHFGRVSDVASAHRQLRASIQDSMKMIKELRAQDIQGPVAIAQLSVRLHDRMEAELAKQGLELSSAEWKLLKLDIDLNAQGLAVSL